MAGAGQAVEKRGHRDVRFCSVGITVRVSAGGDMDHFVLRKGNSLGSVGGKW